MSTEMKNDEIYETPKSTKQIDTTVDYLLTELKKPENVDILLELRDPEFITRQHHSRATYADGCHGPLCRKAERDRGRRRQEQKAARAGRTYIPVPQHRKLDREDLLNAVYEWHLSTRQGGRLLDAVERLSA